MNNLTRKKTITSLAKANNTFHNLVQTLAKISQDPPNKFTGIGILVYNGNFLGQEKFISLRPNISPPENLILNKEKTLLYLRKISVNKSVLHDGYIFANNKGLITHIAQYLEVRFDDAIKPHNEHGTRYLSAQLVSKREGVEFVGNVSSNFACHVFVKGNSYCLDKEQSLNSIS